MLQHKCGLLVFSHCRPGSHNWVLYYGLHSHEVFQMPDVLLHVDKGFMHADYPFHDLFWASQVAW